MTSTSTEKDGAPASARTPVTATFPWNTAFGQWVDNMWHTAREGMRGEPAAEVVESDTAFVVTVDLPGVTRDQVTVDVTGRRMYVHATRTESERTGVLRHTTRTTGEYEFALTVPTDVDDKSATATMADGVLTVTLPKAGGARTTRVEIG